MKTHKVEIEIEMKKTAWYYVIIFLTKYLAAKALVVHHLHRYPVARIFVNGRYQKPVYLQKR